MHETWWEIALDPNHIIAELIWTIIFDGIFIAVIYKLIIKRYLLPKIKRQIHTEIDEEHGIAHHD
jgi:hypothetical protein